MRHCWKEYCLYIGSICDLERDLEYFDEQYPKIYDDTLHLLQKYFPKFVRDPFSGNVSNDRKVNYNVNELRKCRDCIKHCYTLINRDFKGIKDAILEVKKTPKTMKRIAEVCKVDNLKQPWECYTKIARLRNLNIVPHKEVEYEMKNKEFDKQRLLR